jgi:hypothetical protein
VGIARPELNQLIGCAFTTLTLVVTGLHRGTPPASFHAACFFVASVVHTTGCELERGYRRNHPRGLSSLVASLVARLHWALHQQGAGPSRAGRAGGAWLDAVGRRDAMTRHGVEPRIDGDGWIYFFC